MSWWSWALIGYLGLSVLLLTALATAYGAVGVWSRLQGRRLVRDAERFLVEAGVPV